VTERQDESGSFWRTLPGILSAVAALITAVAGLIVGLNAVSSSGDNAKPTTAGSAISPRPRPALADALAGTWSGKAKQGKNATFDVELTIAKGCAIKETCGSISVSNTPCFGDLSLKAISGDRYEFSVDHFSAGSAKKCTPGAGEYLKRYGDDALLYTTGYDTSIRGILHPLR
jgi:hypothetical protein